MDKLKLKEEKKSYNKEYILNNFNKEKILLQINTNNNKYYNNNYNNYNNNISHNNIIKNKKEMKIPKGRDFPVNYKPAINKNYYPKKQYLNNNILMLNINYNNNQINNHINNINLKKNNTKLVKNGSEVYNNIRTQENSNILPLIGSYKRDNSYQNIKSINNVNYNYKINNNNNRPKLKYIPKYNLKPIKNILKIYN